MQPDKAICFQVQTYHPDQALDLKQQTQQHRKDSKESTQVSALRHDRKLSQTLLSKLMRQCDVLSLASWLDKAG
jgi:hypothetical protein